MARLTSYFAAAALTMLPGSAFGQAEEAVSLMARGSCEPALKTLASLKGPDPASGRKLAEGVRPCRNDRIVAFALTEKALELAPDDPSVSLAHAESLAALEQFKEATALLDRLPPKEASTPSARIVKAEVALGLEDLAAAERQARGLESDASYGPRAKVVIAGVKSGKASKSVGAASKRQLELLNKRADALRKLEAREGEGDSTGGAEPGQGALGSTIHLGGATSFVATNVRKGKTYTFEATGACTRYRRPMEMYSISGIDFRVQIGSEAPIPFAVPEYKEERATVEFVATSNSPLVRVFDRSSADSGTRCSLHDFQILPR